jgi:hypothetical protein
MAVVLASGWFEESGGTVSLSEFGVGRVKAAFPRLAV